MLDEKAACGYSYSIVAHLRWDLRQIFRMAVSEGYISKNPAELLFIPREAKGPEHTAMTLEEVPICFSALEPRERLIVKFAVLAGLRPGEILALKWEHISGTHVVIKQRIYRGVIDTRRAPTPLGKRHSLRD
jgi:integrase